MWDKVGCEEVGHSSRDLDGLHLVDTNARNSNLKLKVQRFFFVKGDSNGERDTEREKRRARAREKKKGR